VRAGAAVHRYYPGGIILASGLDASMLSLAKQIAIDSGLHIWGAFGKPVSLATLAATLKAAGLVA
jgi:hypothetical protein